MANTNKARHAFGRSTDIEAAKQANKINEFDILFLDGDTEPKIGWLDSQGVARIVQGKVQVVRVDVLPTAEGDESVVYIYNNEGYIWNGTECVPMSKSADLTALETQVSDLETQMDNKVDASAVQEMVNTAVEAAVEEATSGEVVEF